MAKPVKMVVNVKVENVEYFGRTSEQESDDNDVSSQDVESSDESDNFRDDFSNRWHFIRKTFSCKKIVFRFDLRYKGLGLFTQQMGS